MASDAPGDTSNTPTAAASAPATAPTTATTAPVSASAPATTPATAPSATPATDSPASTSAAAPVETAATKEPATQATAPAKPAFTLPEDLKLAPEAVSQFETFLTSKAPGADGKFTMTAQELVDNYATQARTAFQRWQVQLAEQDKTWAAESKARFSTAQLAAAETGVGFLTSYEPAFRDLAKSYRNNPAFVNAMRVVGERLSEDEFLQPSAAPVTTQRTRAERMGYVKPKTN